jgi:hypothetical protein
VVRRDEQGVRVHETPTADARTVHHEYVAKQGHLHDAVAAERGLPQKASQIPAGLGEVVRPEALAHLDDDDAIALLGEPERGDGAAESGADHGKVAIERGHGSSDSSA